jgi:hypothetical protein
VRKAPAEATDAEANPEAAFNSQMWEKYRKFVAKTTSLDGMEDRDKIIDMCVGYITFKLTGNTALSAKARKFGYYHCSLSVLHGSNPTSCRHLPMVLVGSPLGCGDGVAMCSCAAHHTPIPALHPC